MTAAHENALVRLTHDVPTLWLNRGDVGVVRSTWLSPANYYEIEFRKPGQCPMRTLVRGNRCRAERVLDGDLKARPLRTVCRLLFSSRAAGNA